MKCRLEVVERKFEGMEASKAAAFFEEWGFVVFRGVLEPTECAATREEIWRSLEAKTPGLSQHDPSTHALLSPKRSGGGKSKSSSSRQAAASGKQQLQQQQRLVPLAFSRLSGVAPGCGVHFMVLRWCWRWGHTMKEVVGRRIKRAVAALSLSAYALLV